MSILAEIRRKGTPSRERHSWHAVPFRRISARIDIRQLGGQRHDEDTTRTLRHAAQPCPAPSEGARMTDPTDPRPMSTSGAADPGDAPAEDAAPTEAPPETEDGTG